MGLVVAPASLLTGLGIYFGFLHTHAFYRYLNIDASVLGFSTTDYLIRSVNGFLVPMAVLALAALAFGLAHVGLEAALSSGRQGPSRLRYAPPFLIILGILLVINAVSILIHGSGVLFSPYLAAPASMCVGVFLTISGLLLTDVGKRVRQAPRPHVYGIAAVSGLLLVVGALWGTAQYADSTGRQEARIFVHYLNERPAVVIYSREPLGIGLMEYRITSAAEHPSYRYSGGPSGAPLGRQVPTSHRRLESGRGTNDPSPRPTRYSSRVHRSPRISYCVPALQRLKGLSSMTRGWVRELRWKGLRPGECSLRSRHPAPAVRALRTAAAAISIR